MKTEVSSKAVGRTARVIVCAMAAALVCLFTGCATYTATSKATNFEKKPIKLAGERQYEILGPVALSKGWYGVLGFTYGVPQLGIAGDMYLWQFGGVTYVDLVNKAKEQYPSVDAVVDINVDYVGSKYWMFYSNRENVVYGLAIRYIRGAEGSVFPPIGDFGYVVPQDVYKYSRDISAQNSGGGENPLSPEGQTNAPLPE